jgi:propanediol dehydratase small subunit
MGKWIFIVVVVVISIVLALLVEVKRYKALSRYWGRLCTGSQWRKRFPNASKEDIRGFMGLFVDALNFPRKRRFSFSPDDRVMDVYRACYPPKWTVADAMELESLLMDFKKTYNVDLMPLWREDITLAELYAISHEQR